MGKPWLLYKLTAGKSRKSGGDSSSCSSGGCMSAIFHRHLPFHQPSLVSETLINIHQEQPNNILKGVEAPRNSLELEEQELVVEEIVSSSSSSSSSKLNKEINFNIPMSGIQIKTKRSRLMEDVSLDSCSSSPGTKTPNLVARLMGLDLLPESSSARPSSSYKNNNARSLPATPRISTEIDRHHRFSLQIIDENTSKYAKQIAKQVRENINRRVGADITNTVNKREQRRDEFLMVLKQKRPTPPFTATATGKSTNLDQEHRCGEENELMPVSCSPRLRFLKIENNLNKPNSNPPTLSPLSSCPEVIKAPSLATTKSPPLIMKVQKCKRIASDKYDLRLKKMQRREEPFVKKCNKKSIPLSKHLVNVSTSTILPQTRMPLSSVTLLPGSNDDTRSSMRVVGAVVFKVEAEELVTEIERDVVDTLVNEMARIIWHVGC